MTTISCWFNRESSNHFIWICGDSKISISSTTLLESGSKIFSIPLLCLAPSDNGFFSRPIYYKSIGMAYAGSSLVALNLNAALSTLLSRLITIHETPPSLDDVVSFAARLLKLYVSQLSIASAAGALCEIAIAGHCPINGDLRIYHLEPIVETNSFEYKVTAYSDLNTDDDFVLLLGADKERILDSISQERARMADKNITWWRVPQAVIRKEVNSPQNPTIGGHMQLGIGSVDGFQLCQLVGLQPNSISYLGFDLSQDFGAIGSCQIGLMGMI